MVSTPDIVGTSLKTIAMLAIVLGTLIIFLFIIKYLTQQRGISQDSIKILATCHVAPKKQIILIEVFNEKILIGVTPDNMICLTKMSSASHPIDSAFHNHSKVLDNQTDLSEKTDKDIKLQASHETVT